MRYTFNDFIARVRRSSLVHTRGYYLENQSLFINRPDMLTRAISLLNWDKGIEFLRAARFVQDIPVEAYTAALSGMARACRRADADRSTEQILARVGATGSDSLSPNLGAHRVYPNWRDAVAILDEAKEAYGFRTPARCFSSVLAVMAPYRPWKDAVGFLRTRRKGADLSANMVINAAVCCSTDSSWEHAVRLIEAGVNSAPEAFTYKTPAGIDNENALLCQKRTEAHIRDERLMLLLCEVMSSVPRSVSSKIPIFIVTMDRVLELARNSSGASARVAAHAFTLCTRPMSWEELLSLISVEGRRPLWTPALVAAVAHLVPLERFSEISAGIPASLLAGREVQLLLLHRAVDEERLGDALDIFASLVNVFTSPLPTELASTLALHFWRVRAVHECVRLMELCTLSGTKLTLAALVAGAECALLTVREGTGESSELTTGTTLPVITKTAAVQRQKVHWKSVVQWITELSAEGSNDPCNPSHAPLYPRLLTPALYICAEQGAAEGALELLRHAQAYGNPDQQIRCLDALRALLECVVYERPHEARTIITHFAKKNNENDVQCLLTMYKFFFERSAQNSNCKVI